VTMSEYLHFPFLSGASISKGPPLTSQDPIEQHTTRPLFDGQAIPVKTDHQKSVEVEDPKIVATQERKARAIAKKREKKKQKGDGGEGSRPATKRRKTAAHRDDSAASEATSSPEPIRTINPNNPSAAVAETAESREDRSPRESPRGSADHSVNYDTYQGDGGTETLRLGTSKDLFEKAANADTEVVQSPPSPRDALYGNAEAGKSSRKRPVYAPNWTIHQRCCLDTPMWYRELMVHLAPPAAQEESNALNNSIALEKAWFSLAQGALAQTDILERFETLQANFDELSESHAECGDLAGKLVQTRLRASEDRNRELSQVNKDQTLRIKELLTTLAMKDYARVYAKRLNVEHAREKEKLGKGLAEERSKESLLELIGRMEGFDVHADTKMKFEYDKLFERQYPYVEKISCGFRHSVSDLLKVYPDSPPFEQAPQTSAHNQPHD
ncbi:hypothetical protein Tco_1007331, partial [Tanacetum coccineum]